MDGQTDGRTVGWMDGRTDRPSYRDAFLTETSKRKNSQIAFRSDAMTRNFSILKRKRDRKKVIPGELHEGERGDDMKEKEDEWYWKVKTK